MKIMITGSKGQLGNAINDIISNGKNSLGTIPTQFIGAEVIGVDIDSLDISDENAVFSFIVENKPDIIINCAAMTNVDGCEDNPEAAYSANAKGPENLAKAAQNIGAKLIHISTDYVFKGDATIPYVESDATGPVTEYGKSKLGGEKAVLENCSKHFILRTSWLYGYIGNNFVKTIMKVAKEKGVLKVVDDQRGNPTNADDLAFHILALAATENYGIYHCTGTGECSWYDFACKILKFSNIPCNISPCSTEASGRKAKRPAFSSLKNLHLEETIGDKMRYWEDALEEYIENLNKRMEQTR